MKMPLLTASLGLTAGLLLVSFAFVCRGQGTLHITFDGPPLQPPGTSYFVQQYFEAGMWFRPLGVVGPGNGFGRRGANPSTGWPDNGTAYLQAGLGDSLMFSFTDNSMFDLLSVDLSEFSTLYQTPLTVSFVGYRHDGSIVTADLTTDGIIDGTGPVPDFQTFYFGPEFAGLDRVEIPTSGWCLDNLVVSVPEPTSGVLLLAGGVLLWRLRRVGFIRRGVRLRRAQSCFTGNGRATSGRNNSCRH